MSVLTRNDLPHHTREAVIGILGARLIDAIDLRLSLKQAHWTVKGPNFIGLHELFDQIQGHVATFEDDLAERIAALGGVANGTTQAVALGTRLKAYPGDITAERQHVEAVADRLASFGKLVRAGIDASDEVGDKGTADLFTSISRRVDKDLWLVEAHLG
jgi:starvation-inducible DNA-binding protein